MPSTRDIRRRIKSVKNTAQITKAMQMVAASKMRKAQQAALAGRPYARLMNKVLAEVASETREITHPFLEKREGTRRCVILVSTDKGLCGSLNSNLMREAAKFENGAQFITAGRKGSQFLARTRRQMVAEFTFKDAPLFGEARAISKFASDLFLKGEVDRVDIVFTNFVSTLVQKSEVRQLLPISEVAAVQAGMGADKAGSLPGQTGEFLFEPDQEHVLAALLPHSLNFQIYQILLEAKASEHSARMVAMKNATDNAQQFIKDLTLEYNKLRQANITKELLEIASAAMAMN
ncbi:MAG TPA: ATP synthase F1 subunit gamma [Candidatus Acidoferrum sp.]|nr:ATP synthase F1 subunit gamma [Candidatus Acidoferrum sp.]